MREERKRVEESDLSLPLTSSFNATLFRSLSLEGIEGGNKCTLFAEKEKNRSKICASFVVA